MKKRKKTTYSASQIANMILIAAELEIKLGPNNIDAIYKYYVNRSTAKELAPLN